MVGILPQLMPEIQQPKNTKKKISAKLILSSIVALFVFLLLFSSAINLMRKYFSMRSHIKNLKEEQMALIEKKDAISQMNEYIQTKEGREEVFRDKYRLVKPGEGLIVVTEPAEKREIVPERKQRFFASVWSSILEGLGLR